jgi:hypothetical protein
MKVKHHMRANIEGMLRHYKRRKMDGLMNDENGDPMSDFEARKYLKEAKAKGWKVIPCGDCEGFDHFGGGCPGHPVIEEIHSLLRGHYAVALPAGYIPSSIDEYMGTPCVVCSSDEVIDDRLFLPPGSWQLICTSKECTEESLKPMDDILQHHNFKEWFLNFEGRDSYFTNRASSMASLLRSKGCDPDKSNYAILKKQ